MTLAQNLERLNDHNMNAAHHEHQNSIAMIVMVVALPNIKVLMVGHQAPSFSSASTLRSGKSFSPK